MFSTSISSVNGGNISIIAGGYVKAGPEVFSVPSTAARGIFTTVQSDISVIANGDINVNGSRIATFDGGDITVESLTGQGQCRQGRFFHGDGGWFLCGPLCGPADAGTPGLSPRGPTPFSASWR